MTVLNIGVGTGGLESILIQKKIVVDCLDPSAETIERLRMQYGLGIRAQVGFSQNMPYQDSKFDVVIMSEVLEHLTDEVLHSTLAEVRRVLKPAGRFIGTVPANEQLVDNQSMCPHCGELFHRWGHVQSFSLSRMSEVLSLNKLSVQRVEIRAFPDWRRKGIKNLIKSLFRYVLGRCGAFIAKPNIYFQAQK